MWRLLAALLALQMLVFLAPSGACAERLRPAGDAVIGLQLEPPGLDPTASPAAAVKDVIFNTVLEGLTRLGTAGRVEPLLATRWTVSPDGLAWRFDLRSGVRFQDGAPFDAFAAKAVLDRARAQGSLNGQRRRFAVIARITALGPLQLELQLNHPYALLPQVLGWGDAAMISPRSLATASTRPVGTGPFRFVRWRRGYALELERNPAYWGARPGLDHLTFRFIDDPTAALTALRAGDVDAFPGFPTPEAVAALRHDPQFVVRVAPTEAKTIMALNNRRPPLADVRVRRALAYAVDRRAVIDDAMFGFGTPIGSHYPPQDPGYVDLTGLYPYDPAKARALLAAAGTPHPRLTLRLPPPPYARRAGELIAAQLTAVGVRVKIEDLEWAPWLEQVFGRHDFDMTIVSHVEPADYDIYSRDDYYFGYRSARVKADLGALDLTLDPARRNVLLGDIQRTIAEDAANVFLFEYPAIGVWNVRMSRLWAPTPVQVFDYATARASGPAARGVRESTAPPAWLWTALLVGLVVLAGFALRRLAPAAVARRGVELALTLLVSSIVVFLMVQVAPGDPARTMMGLNADPAAITALRAELGLDAPVWLRYLRWLAGLFQGDFGLSYTYRTSVGALIAERLTVSGPLTLYALLISTALALAIGLVSSAAPGGLVDRGLNVVTLAGLSVPNFWLGMLLVLAFSQGLRWADAGGFPGWATGVGPALAALTLPALALAIPQGAVLGRVLREELVSQIGAAHMLTARAKGAGPWRLLLRHALPNAAPAALTVLGLQFSFLLAGAVIVENVFSLPGLGRLVFQAVASRDLIVVQGTVVLLVGIVVLVAFAVDLLAAALDPRILARRP